MFMALMCDGITDVMQDDEAHDWCQFVPTVKYVYPDCQICAELEMRRPGPPDPVKRSGPGSHSNGWSGAPLLVRCQAVE